MIGEKETRLPIEAVRKHVLFWDWEKKLQLLIDVSDKLEYGFAKNPLVPALNEVGAYYGVFTHCGEDWSSVLDLPLVQELEKYRKYDLTSLANLVRFIRNKRNHFRELPRDF